MTVKSTWVDGDNVTAAAMNDVANAVNDNTTAVAGKQAADADLATIAGLSPADGDTLLRVSGAWATRTIGQLKTALGLGNADNTSDASKPVSTATQTALDLKAPIASPAFTGTPTGITKSHVGLGNADNTSDASKPVSTATQTALDGKQTLDADLTALAAIASGDGFAKRVGSDWATSPTLGKVDIAQPVCIVEDGIGLPQGATASTAGTTENVMKVAVAASHIQLLYQHFQNDDSLASGTITFNASINYAPASAGAVGTIYRVTFGGRTTCTLDPGGVILSDPVNLNVKVGDLIAPRTYLASGTAYSPRVLLQSTAKGGFTTTTDLTAPGSAAISSTSFTGYPFGPCMVLGLPTPGASARSVFNIGDSIGRGAGDGSFGTDAPQLALMPWQSMGGYALRALVGHAGYINTAKSGDTAQNVALATRYHSLATATRATSAIISLGTNDLTNGRTAAQLEADILTIATVLQRMGVQKIFAITAPPVTTSTDAWATTTNQTVAGSNTTRITHNNWVRGGCPINPTTLAPVTVGAGGALLAGSGGHPITGYFEVADTVESSRDSGKWKAATRVVATGAMTSGSGTLNATGAAFTSADLGRSVDVVGAGAASGLLNFAYISAVNSATQAVLTSNAGTTVSGAQTVIGGFSHDGTHPTPDGHLAMSAAIDYTKL